MPHPALALSLSLSLSLWALQGAPTRVEESRARIQVSKPESSVLLDQAAGRNEEVLRRAKERGTVAVTVLVEGKRLEVPEPPSDAKLARAQWSVVGSESNEALRALRHELDLEYKAQTERVAYLKAHPEEGKVGIGSDLHKRIWAVIKNESLKKEEQTLMEGTAKVLERMIRRAEADEEAMSQATMNAGSYVDDWELGRDKFQRPGQAIRAFQGAAFLKEYAPVWQAYAPHLRSYLTEAASLLAEAEVDEAQGQVSTQILTRALRIQFMERVGALVAYNQRIWALGASHVVEPKWFHSASRTSMLPYGSGALALPNN
ncbi:MAG TPA: hypothetical protein VJ623_11910 [Holophagaceae bacterium]|nr:hypothetical protein [Holophagaceae bacterium]